MNANDGLELIIPHPKELLDYPFVETQIQIQQLLKPSAILDAAGKNVMEPDGIIVLCAIKIPHEHVSKFLRKEMEQPLLFSDNDGNPPKLKLIHGVE